MEYSCVDGHYLSGGAAARCGENQKWVTGAMVCKSMSSLYQQEVFWVLLCIFSMQMWIQMQVNYSH